MQLSPHFTLEELVRSANAARLGIDNSPTEDQVELLRLLCVNALEPIRQHFGPVTVDSGFRCQALNDATTGSASDSRHLTAQAADIVIPGVAPIEVCRWAVTNLPSFDQVIYEYTWTHVAWCATGNRRSVLTKRSGAPGYLPGLVG